MSKKCLFFVVFAMAVMAVPVWADSLSGLADVTVVDGAIISLRYADTEYVVADGDLVLGITTRWYILDGVETFWVEGDPAPPATVPGSSDPKVGDVGSNADNFLFTLDGGTNISSIDGIDFQETIFPSLTDTFFLFERGGNDVGSWQAILEDGSLGPEVAFVKAADGGPYADTGVSVNGQNAYGVVFTTDVPVMGVRINAPGHDTLSISTPKELPPGPKVVWVSDAYDDSGDGVADDLPWIDLLEAEGYSVDYTMGSAPGDGYWRTLDDDKIAALNAADLIIVSRNSNSGDYASDATEVAQWNSVTTPIILSSTHIVRNSRWKWLDTGGTDNAASVLMEVVDAASPLFAGVTIDADGHVSAMTDKNCSFASIADAGNGTVIASRSSDGEIWIAEWEAGVEFYAGAGEFAGGPRMFFVAGTQEDTAVGIGRGEVNLTADGIAIFLNAVKYLTSPKDVTAPGDAIQGVPNDGLQDGSGDFGWPAAETPDLAIDDNVDTKYLHFKGDIETTGLQITPAMGPTIVTGLTLTTANDTPGRDPIAFELSGSNDGIDGPYELIASGDIADFAQEAEWPRFTMNATPISFANEVAYAHYQLLFPAIRGPVGGSVNSMQIAEVELLGIPSPVAAPELVAAYAFGSRALDCATYNDPSVNYTMVLHVNNEPGTIQYDSAKGYGYEVIYPTDSPFGDRAGFGVFGPFDDSANNRNEFPDECPEELYDSFIGAKSFTNEVSAVTMGDMDTPSPNPEGIIFRVDVPNGLYRFVGAFGEADNGHAHRILAEDGGSGPPENIGLNHVVLVHNHDQSQYDLNPDMDEPGDAVFARVGFDGLIPPPGDGVAPSPVFVDMDENGRPADVANCPILEVTQGYVRIHQLQGNSNDGPGGSRDANGGDIVILELWKVGL